jgi:hypothetical protein
MFDGMLIPEVFRQDPGFLGTMATEQAGKSIMHMEMRDPTNRGGRGPSREELVRVRMHWKLLHDVLESVLGQGQMVLARTMAQDVLNPGATGGAYEEEVVHVEQQAVGTQGGIVGIIWALG